MIAVGAGGAEDPGDAQGSLTLGLVGLGEVHRWHADALRRLPRISAIAAYDRDPKKEARLSGVVRASSLEEVLECNLDAVLVAVPTPDHQSVARNILESGTDVILEKPATLDRAGLDLLYAIADDHDANLLVAFHDAYGVELEHFRSHLRSRLQARHGPLRRIQSRFTDPYVARGAADERVRSLHGSWHDSGVNALSVVCTLEGGFTIESCGMEDLPGFGDLTTLATYQSARSMGPSLTVQTDWTVDEKEKTTRLEYDDAAAILDHGARTVTVEGDGRKLELFRAESELPRLTEQYVRLFGDLSDPGAAVEANRLFSREVHGLLFDALERASA